MTSQPGGGDFPWTEDAIARLHELWASGLSTARIAAALGKPCTKNAVIGKAHRLNLPRRPSPIRDATAPKPRKPIQRVQHVPSLPVLHSVASAFAPTPKPREMLMLVEPTLPSSPPPVLMPAPSPVIFKPRKATACCWPFGDPKSPEFRFCDATAQVGRSYCQEHHALAYEVKRPRSAAGLAADEQRRQLAFARMSANGGAWKSGSRAAQG